MKNLYRAVQSSLIVYLLLAPPWAHARQRADLNSEEVGELRNAQDPSKRISVYLSIAQTRLYRVEGLRNTSPEAQANIGWQVNELLGQYISIDSELKGWIQDQYDHKRDMRSGLRHLLKVAPGQLQFLEHIRSSPGPGASAYSESLRDAIANMNDTINGATEALAAQEKMFPEMKRESKAEARALKKERKEEAKRNKEEEKLNKKEAERNKKERELRERQQKKNNANNFGEN
ncbi:MAG: DUF1682 domain-containing protein [Acidobacteria bacterium]|nr:DUF1682 domain-containing protein [Acidobacteriota bacterium]